MSGDKGREPALIVSGMEVLVSPDDLPKVSAHRWVIGTNGYVYRGGSRKRGLCCLMHRFILDDPKGFEVHHRNHIKTDNRRENLEVLRPGQHQREHHADGIIKLNISRRKHPLVGVCRYCGKTFQKNRIRAGTQVMCSMECSVNNLRIVGAKYRKEQADALIAAESLTPEPKNGGK